MSDALWLSLRAQAHNNAWANHRLGLACEKLAPSELTAPKQNFFPTLIETLNHILIVDWYYVSALEGSCLPPSEAFASDIPCPDLADLHREQRAIDRRFIALFERAPAPNSDVVLIRKDGPVTEQFHRVALHLIQHQIHHRGQAHAMLSGCGITPAQLDEFYLAWDADRDLRKPDLDALRMSEGAIWGNG